jgi:hypothetical protein
MHLWYEILEYVIFIIALFMTWIYMFFAYTCTCSVFSSGVSSWFLNFGIIGYWYILLEKFPSEAKCDVLIQPSAIFLKILLFVMEITLAIFPFQFQAICILTSLLYTCLIMFHGYMVQENDMAGNDTGFLLNSFCCSFIQILNVLTFLQPYGMYL